MFATCEGVFLNEFWDTCKQYLSTEDYVDICKFEYCLDPEPEVLNRVVDSYAEACRALIPRTSKALCGYKSEQYFSDLGLVADDNAGYKQCSGDTTFSGCLFPSKDLKSCEDFRLGNPISNTETAISGCKCPADHYLLNGVCTESSSCPTETTGDGAGFDSDGDGQGDGQAEDPCTQEQVFEI